MITVTWDCTIKSEIERARKVFNDKKSRGVSIYSPARKKIEEFDEKMQKFIYINRQDYSEDSLT